MRLLFVDDIRDFPLPNVEYDGEFDVARNCDEALGLLKVHEYTYVWLDHDLGMLETIHPVVMELVQNDYPSIEGIWVHSSNPPAAATMVNKLSRYYPTERYYWR